MSNAHGLTKENLLFTFPASLRENTSIAALGDVTMEALAKRPEEIGLLSLYARIDELPEELLDILAYDFKVDWWDADYDLEAKRRTLKTSWKVHKTLGTKAAVETAASAVYPDTRVKEWFEYGGEPYHFRLDVDLPEDGWTPERHKRLMWMLQYYKNLRSHLDSVIYRMKPVVLENQRAFWFSALYISLRERFKGQLALERMLLAARVTQPQGNILWLRLRGTATTSFDGSLESVLFHMRANNFGQEIIRLDGRRRLNGSWLLKQGMIRGPALASIKVTTGAQNRLSASTAVTSDTMWRLDGTYRLNGEKKLNAKIVRSEL